MKEKIPAFILVGLGLLLTASCTKTSTSNPNPPPPPGGGGGGGGNGTLSVTSITPSNPYPDDEFTIIGTGFNANKTLDTVEFGHLTNGNFGAWHGGVPEQYSSLCTVISATATQLKVKAVNPNHLDADAFNFSPTSIAVAQIRTGGKKVVTPLIPFKRLMLLNGIDDPDAHISWGRPADSLVINGMGFNKNATLTIGGIALSNLKVDSTAYNSQITLRLPKLFFGGTNDENVTETRSLSVKNADGKTLTKDFTFFMSPRMRVFGMQASANSYSRTSGGVIKITITGRNLKSDAVMSIASPNGYHSEFTLATGGGFPDVMTIELGVGTFPVGNYQMNMERAGFLYGAVTWSVSN